MSLSYYGIPISNTNLANQTNLLTKIWKCIHCGSICDVKALYSEHFRCDFKTDICLQMQIFKINYRTSFILFSLASSSSSSLLLLLSSLLEAFLLFFFLCFLFFFLSLFFCFLDFFFSLICNTM